MRLLQESGLPGGQQIGAEGMPAAHLGWGLGPGQDLQDDLGLELGREATSFLHAGASPFGPPGSLCTCPIRGAHYSGLTPSLAAQVAEQLMAKDALAAHA